MNYGSLHVRLPDNREIEFPLNRPEILVGRTPDNDLVITHATISRKHARLRIVAGQVIVEDLGSTNGTFFGKHRLTPNTPVKVSSDQDIWLGNVEVRYNPPSAIKATTETIPAIPGAFQRVIESTLPGYLEPPPVTLSLAGPYGSIEPGYTTTARLTIQNRTSRSEEFLIRISGLPFEWFSLSKEKFQLDPDETADVTITFKPPRRVEATAGEHQFRVTVYSSEQGKNASASGVLEILPYHNFKMVLEPAYGSGEFNLQVSNLSNFPLIYRFSGNGQLALKFDFKQPSVRLEAGQKASLPLKVSPQARPVFGRSHSFPFTIHGNPVTAIGRDEKITGNLLVTPLLPIWLLPVIVVLTLCASLTGILAYVRICPQFSFNLPFCPPGTPVIRSFTAEPVDLQVGESVIISWEVSNARQVQLYSPAIGLEVEVPRKGSQSFMLVQSSTFMLRASSANGTSQDSLDVIVRGSPPVIQNFQADPGAIVAGQMDSINLAWSVLGAQSVMIVGAYDQVLPAVGELAIPAPEVDTTYTLVVKNDSGEIRQDLTVFVISAGCVVTNIPTDETLTLHIGPAGSHPALVHLAPGSQVELVGRDSGGYWLKVRVEGTEGWVDSRFVTCVVAMHIFPTIDPALVPSPPPMITSTPEPTLTPTPLATATPTPGAILPETGFITYRVQNSAGATIYLQRSSGSPRALVANKIDAQILDYTVHDGGRFAIWAVEDDRQMIYLILPDGGLVAGPLYQGWDTVTDGYWSVYGHRLVIETISDGKPAYFYFTANGELTSVLDTP
jgi:pSer/pThr/pTyr-binding forkhead associated (FHA) protein